MSTHTHNIKMAITTAINDLLSSIYELLASVFGTVYAVIHSVIVALLGFVRGLFNLIGDVASGLVDVAGGVGKFVAGMLFFLFCNCFHALPCAFCSGWIIPGDAVFSTRTDCCRQCCSSCCWRHRGVCLCEIHGAGTAYREQEDPVKCQIQPQAWEHWKGSYTRYPDVIWTMDGSLYQRLA